MICECHICLQVQHHFYLLLSLMEYLNFGPTHDVLRKSWQCGESRCRSFDWHALHLNSQTTVSSSPVIHIIYCLPFWRNGKDGTWETDYITSYPKELFVVKEDYFRQKIILNVKGIYLHFQSMVMAYKNDELISGEKEINILSSCISENVVILLSFNLPFVWT